MIDDKMLAEFEDYCYRKSLSDEYLEENEQRTRKDCWYGDFSYGIVYIAEDYALPAFKHIARLKELNREMVELLKRLPESMLQSSSPYCPYCHHDLIVGHDEDCDYTLVLSKAEEGEGCLKPSTK